MEELVSYQKIKELSEAYINKQGKIIRKKNSSETSFKLIDTILGSKTYYLPILLISLIGFQTLGFVSVIDSDIFKFASDSKSEIIISAILIAIIPIVTVLTIWFILKPRRKNQKKNKTIIQGINYILYDN